MKSLFLYYAKKRLLVLTIVVVIALITSIVISLSYDMLYPAEYSVSIRYSFLGYLTTILCVFATIIPIYEFSFKMHKNSVDLLYSLPIKKYKLYIVKYLIGLLELFIIFTVCFLYIFLYASAHFVDTQNSAKLIYYFYYYLISLGFGALLYNWVAFFFTRANTIVDGIIITILSVFLIVILCAAFIDLTKLVHYDYFGSSDWRYTPYSSIVYFTRYFNVKIKSLHPNVHFYDDVFYSSLIMSIIGTIFIPLFFILSNKQKTENASDISNEWYTYKLFIPLYVVCMCEFLGQRDNSLNILNITLVIIGGYICYVIYNRTFKIKKVDLIVLLSSATFGILLPFAIRFIADKLVSGV